MVILHGEHDAAVAGAVAVDVGLRQEDAVGAAEHWAGGIDARVAPGAPEEGFVRLSAGGVDAEQAAGGGVRFAACEDEDAVLAMELSADGGCVALAPCVAGHPAEFAGGEIEGSDAAVLRATEVDDDEVLVHERGGTGSEEVLGDTELRFAVVFPDEIAACGVPALESAGDSEGDDFLSGDDRARARAAAVSEVVAVIDGVAVRPEALAGDGVEAVDGFAAVPVMEEVETSGGDGRAGVGFAARAFPDQWRAGFREAGDEAGFRRDRVVGWAEEAWPV